MNSYDFFQWLMFFYIYCFIGWCFESSYVSLKEHRWVNRGFLTLPMLPIYGSGALAILVVTIPVRGNFVLVYIFGLLSSTLLEYVTGAVMERLFKVRYWDYTNQKFNVKGYICLSSSIAWGFMSILLTEVIHNPIEQLVLNMNPVVMAVILTVVSIVFIFDTIASFKAAWDLRKILERAQQLKEKAEEIRGQLNELAQEKTADLTEKMQETKDGLAEKMQETKDGLAEKMQETKDGLAEKMQETKDGLTNLAEKMQETKEGFSERVLERREEKAERKEARSEKMAQQKEALEASLKEVLDKLESQKLQPLSKFFIRAKLRDNPDATSARFGETLAELKEKVNRRSKKGDAENE